MVSAAGCPNPSVRPTSRSTATDSRREKHSPAGSTPTRTRRRSSSSSRGEATFETFSGEVTVASGEAIRFAPGEFQSGRNGGDDDLVLVALGSPRETEDVRIPLACPDCGRDDLRLDFGGDELALVCPDCGAEHVPLPCPECGSDDVRVTLGRGTETVVVCHDCAAELEKSPFES